MNEILQCPVCARILPSRPPCKCGFVLRESDGVLDLLRPGDTAGYEPLRMAHKQVPAATLSEFESIARPGAKGIALDIGAGNCWLTRYLDDWGFAAFALDINTSERDGLKAGQTYIDGGARFVRIRSSMERLPIADSRVSLLVANASVHYGKDFAALLAEFRRVLEPEGRIVIMQTPLHRSQLDDSLRGLDLRYRMVSAAPGFRRAYRNWRSRLLGNRTAEFPIVVLQK